MFESGINNKKKVEFLNSNIFSVLILINKFIGEHAAIVWKYFIKCKELFCILLININTTIVFSYYIIKIVNTIFVGLCMLY